MVRAEARDAWRRYKSDLDTFEQAAALMRDRLRELTATAGIKVEVEARAKDLASFAKKAINRTDYDDPWQQITDKVGARVIAGSLGDRDRVVALIESSALEVLRVERKSDEAKPDQLFYPGVHIQAVVPDTHDAGGGTVEVEIQVRTKAEDLWCVPSHSLTYKGVVPTSALSERRMWRLTTLVELFDEEVQAIMDDVASSPRYASAQLLKLLEAQFLRFTAEPGNDFILLKCSKLWPTLYPQPIAPHTPRDWRPSCPPSRPA